MLEAPLGVEHEGEKVTLFVRGHGSWSCQIINDPGEQINRQQLSFINVQFIHEEAHIAPKGLIEKEIAQPIVQEGGLTPY